MPHSVADRYRLLRVLAAIQAAAFFVCVLAYRRTGLAVAWTTVPMTLPLIAGALALWLAGRRRGRGEAALALAIVLSFSTIALLLQYAALAAGRPFIDAGLLRADAAMGISVPDLAAWTAAHPAAHAWLESVYSTLGLQLLIAIAVVTVHRDREALWEFVLLYHCCLGATVASCWLWPANEPWVHSQLPDMAQQAGIIGQVMGYHSGALRIVDVGRPEGLVTMPSFHVAAAWLATWTVRRSRPALCLLSVMNVALTASTVMTGRHYVVDALAGAALLTTSIVACRWATAPRLMESEERLMVMDASASLVSARPNEALAAD